MEVWAGGDCWGSWNGQITESPVISHPGVHPLLTRQASPAKTVAGDRRKQTGTFPSGLAGVNDCDEINSI